MMAVVAKLAVKAAKSSQSHQSCNRSPTVLVNPDVEGAPDRVLLSNGVRGFPSCSLG